MADMTTAGGGQLPVLVTATELADCLGLSRPRITQLRGSDPTFPKPLTEETVNVFSPTPLKAAVWARESVLEWAQRAGRRRTEDGCALPLFPTTDKSGTWEGEASGSLTVRDATVGWRAYRSSGGAVLVVVVGSAGMRDASGLTGKGPDMRLSAQFVELVGIQTGTSVDLPDFFTLVVAESGGTNNDGAAGGPVVSATVSTADLVSEGRAADWIPAAWTSARDVAGLTGHSLPWFVADPLASEAVSAWSPHQRVAVAAFDDDALFVHQAVWLLGQLPAGDDATTAGALTVVADLAAANVTARYDHTWAQGWESAVAYDLPPVPEQSTSVAIEVAAKTVLAGDELVLTPFMRDYLINTIDRRVVRIPVRGLPRLFSSAADTVTREAGDLTPPMMLVTTDSGDSELVATVSDSPHEAAVPIAASASVRAYRKVGAVGSAVLNLHADGTLTVGAVDLP